MGWEEIGAQVVVGRQPEKDETVWDVQKTERQKKKKKKKKTVKASLLNRHSEVGYENEVMYV